MKEHVSIGIAGMHCASCAKLISESLLELKGVEEASVSFPDEKAEIVFDPEKVTLEKIEGELGELGYGLAGSPPFPRNAEKPGMAEETLRTKAKEKSGIKQGVLFGLVPHLGCIGFLAASIIGATVAVEFFKPLLMNPWFFHILVLISVLFATVSAAFYLRRNGILSFAGIARKKKYLATMYGSTVGINLILFLLVFPLLANIDTGSFGNTTGAAAVALNNGSVAGDSVIKLQVNIPCSGHASLISGELKKIAGVTGVKFDLPNYFSVAFDSGKTSKQQILSLEVFETYSATVVEESVKSAASLSGIKEVELVSSKPQASGGGCCGGGSSCGSAGSTSGSSCGSAGGGCGCGAK
jgi:copper chaperone CopZ